MAILDPLYGTPLAVQLIPQVDRNFAEHLKLRDDQRSIGLLSVDNDDATYTAIDEATKMANVEVVYARSFYAGAKHTSGKWSGDPGPRRGSRGRRPAGAEVSQPHTPHLDGRGGDPSRYHDCHPG